MGLGYHTFLLYRIIFSRDTSPVDTYHYKINISCYLKVIFFLVEFIKHRKYNDKCNRELAFCLIKHKGIEYIYFSVCEVQIP